MKSLIILRGLPGSGKSTFAQTLSENGKYKVFCIDDYFTNIETGEYVFEFEKNYLAYQHCEERTKNAMEKREEKIIVENTFTLGWEIEPYFKLASMFDYKVFVVTVENYHSSKNIHNIGDEQIKKMSEKYKVKLF